jgi:hypothetical protein
MTKTTTTPPRFLQAAGGSSLFEEEAPWAQLAKTIAELRKAIDIERDPVKRAGLIQEHGALLARRERGRMAKSLLELTPPLTFAQRLDLNRRLEEIPDLVSCLMDTVAAIVYSPAARNRDQLLATTFEEFTTAVFEVDGPLGDTTVAKAFRLQKAADAKSVTERLAELDREIRDLEKAIDTQRNQGQRQALQQRLADLKRKREPLLAEKQKKHPGSNATIPRTM